MELWDWFRQERLKAINTGASKYIAMINHYAIGSRRMHNQETDIAYNEFVAGLSLAQELKEPCWELFFMYWQLETRTYFEWNIKAALEIGIKTSTLAYKPAYQACAVRPQIFLTLAEVYSFMDSVGYKSEIDELCDYILKETPPADDGKRRIQYMQACVAFEHDKFQEAEDIISDYMARLLLNPFRETFYHTLMRRISFVRGDIPSAFNFAQDGLRCAKTVSLANPEAWNRLWSAALAQRMGNENIALELYDAACDYHEQRGELERALNLREEQAISQEKIASIQYQAHCALQTARLLGRMGRDMQQSILKAYEIAREFKKPSLYFAKLKRVESGEYFEYDWQN